jgi:putative endonuclease
MHTRTKGDTGEGIAGSFLEKQGFSIITRNYLKKWGELDIVATKEGIIHFFEVKSISVHDESMLKGHRPEDNVHALKLKRLGRTIEAYLQERGGGLGVEFQFHVLCVYMDISAHRARVKWLRNLII